MITKSLTRAVALVLVLLVTTAVATTTAPNASAQNSPVVIKTYMRADLSLKSVFSPELAQPTPAAPLTAAFLRTCVCSCGYRCTTDADCGPGGRCANGITCCNRSPAKDGLGAAFAQREILSSHKNPSHVDASVNCKQ